jgi:calcineurin-like phosphoesterase family protein
LIFITSDTHFFHTNIIRYSNRPFADIEEMNEALIANWNSVVSKYDTVYHLGDFAYGRAATRRDMERVFNRLNGNKHLIVGNHDSDETFDLPWGDVVDYKELKLDFGDLHKQRVVLSHYSFRTWNQAGRGAWMLYGHSHGGLPQPSGKTFDVGVDCQGYKPISVDQIKIRMDSIPLYTEDYHGKQ